MHTLWCHLVRPLGIKVGPTIEKVTSKACVIVREYHLKADKRSLSPLHIIQLHPILPLMSIIQDVLLI